MLSSPAVSVASPSRAEPPTNERRPWLAFLLGFVPGLGQLYGGSAVRAVLALVLAALVLYPVLYFLPAWLCRSRATWILMLFLQLHVYMILPLDALFYCLKRRLEPRTSWNRVHIQIVFALLSAAVLLLDVRWIHRHAWLRYSRVPAASMEPTLRIGDRFVWDARSSVLSSLRRGDIAVFEPPFERGTLYVKRVVGIPGDVVEIRHGELVVNHQTLSAAASSADETWTETFENRSWTVRNSSGLSSGPVRVPEGQWFVLGDNRARSVDSRIWGTISTSLIRGRALRILYSDDPGTGETRSDRFGIDLR